MQQGRAQKRDDGKIIIHFDYDAFYASVVENENPALKGVPLAIQQKQIVVTCNYEARKRGLHKLQLITEAKRVCPDAVIILGEDLTRFRDASKELWNFLRERTWSDRAERLGFDEVWLDCTDMIDYNVELLNLNDLQHSFFCMDRNDPTCGFEYDSRQVFGPTFPVHAAAGYELNDQDRILHTRLILGSHLARHLRHELESQKNYTATVGIATNKTLSKLVGNANKPKNQTVLMPPLYDDDGKEGAIHAFMDAHDIGKVPGIGFKLAHKIRAFILDREPAHDQGLVYGGTKENITVRDVRLHPALNPEKLEQILGGPGSQRGIGGRIWSLLHGYDDAEVGKAKRVPAQISQEDSYMKYLHNFDQVRHQLFLLSERLIRRMHIDLMEDDDDTEADTDTTRRRWLAHPRTLRLTTRPRPPLNPEGTRLRSFNRISHSAPLPTFVFSLTEPPSLLADRLVDTTLTNMFRKLHPERNGWNLSLVNIAVTNMAETAADTKDSAGRDIGRMFQRQEEVLKDFKITEPENVSSINFEAQCETDPLPPQAMQGSAEWNEDDDWQSSGDEIEAGQVYVCQSCGQEIPTFAYPAHMRFHDMVGSRPQGLSDD
ncbi:hypothetical protein LTR05_004273 [Lithohypha guttulata]|uniref:UmuC domain-containing protein n=1 Tax=Lithohypha guttulata TaxID=1690604 RepID=A0AAN7T376_9EURO|nr:hypothetical protein LTR05_004273 [Lithohypha guttulata]